MRCPPLGQIELRAADRWPPRPPRARAPELDPAGQHRDFVGGQFRLRRHLIRFAIVDRVDQQAFARLARHDGRPGVAAGQHAGLRVELQTSFGIVRPSGTPSSAGPTAGGLSARRIRVPRPRIAVAAVGSGRDHGRARSSANPGGTGRSPANQRRPGAADQCTASEQPRANGQIAAADESIRRSARSASRYVPPGGWRAWRRRKPTHQADDRYLRRCQTGPAI